MQRNQIKNFVCSFLVSLLAVSAVTKGVMRMNATPTDTQKSKTPEINTISLFKNQDSEYMASNSSMKADDISIPKIDVSDIENLIAPATKVLKDPYVEAALLVPQLEAEPEKQIKTANEYDKTEELSLAKAEEITLEALGFSDLEADASSSQNQENAQILQEMASINSEVPQNNVVYQPEEAESDIILASLDLPAGMELKEQNSDEALIPIMVEDIGVQHEIDVLKSAEASQIAMLEPNTLINSMEDAIIVEEEKTLAEADLKKSEWNRMSATEEDNPWVVARGNKYAKNRKVVEQFAEPEEELEESYSEPIAEDVEVTEEQPTADEAKNQLKEEHMETFSEVNEIINPEPLLKPIGAETKLAYQMIDNLLIPIPEDVKNDANLTPDLSVTPDNKPEKIERKNIPVTVNNAKSPQSTQVSVAKEQRSLNEEDKKSGLFKSIASWFKSDPEQTQTPIKKEEKKKKTNKKKGLSFFQKNDEGEDSDTDAPVIMPAELRLSFQPNRAEISGQTLSWIHAFADNARDNAGVYIEIRIDGTSSFALQRKRLNLLSTILANRGVDYRKINIVFTSREPNSFIIRNIRFSNEEEIIDSKSNTYYQPW